MTNAARLTALDWLNAWEQSQAQPEALRPCCLLAPILPGGQAEAEALPLGRRDATLLDLHAALLGAELSATTHCRRCGEHLELELSATSLRLPAQPAEDVTLDLEGFHVVCRLPNSKDLSALAGAGSVAAARQGLLERCLRVTDADGDCVPASRLSEQATLEIGAALAQADAQALIELALTCPACAHGFSESFDIGAYFVESLGHWAERLLDQVHVLATAYHWTEGEVLRLSAARRAQYLARVLA